MSDPVTDHEQLESDAIPRWYLIQCKGGESFRAAEHLNNQDYEVFHPVLQVQKKRSGKLQWLDEPLFPYYLFIRLDRMDSNWRPIRSTRGVLKLVGFGNEPTPVDDGLITALRDSAQKTPPLNGNVYFRAGETVEITEGPFRELQAVFESQKGEERAIVLLNMLHSQQRLEMPIRHLRRNE